MEWVIYLRDHFKPCIYLNCTEPTGNCVADFVVNAKFEPKGQKPESIL